MRKLNWRRDLPDHRDFKYGLSLLPKAQERPIPDAVDLRPFCPPVFEQKNIGSCTGQTIAAALEFLALEEIRNKVVGGTEAFTPGVYEAVSRLFIYYQERVIEGTVNEDAGATIRGGIKAVSSFGACREALWPYDESKIFEKPTAHAYEEASKFKATSYYRINSLDEILVCLAEGYPVCFGFSVYDSFTGDDIAKTGVMDMPSATESVQGGHAVLAVGYDRNKKHLIVRNSWGEEWGDQGHFYMPFEVVTYRIAADFWTIRK